MIKQFTCLTVDCVYNINPVFVEDPTDEILCGGCFQYGKAIEWIEPVIAAKKTSKTKVIEPILEESTGPTA